MTVLKFRFLQTLMMMMIFYLVSVFTIRDPHGLIESIE
jgi:hypothetical protein